MFRVILPMTKPVIATVVIFNVLYIWNEYPYASVMLRNQTDYTLSMGASFFKGHLHRGLRRHSRFIGDDHHP